MSNQPYSPDETQSASTASPEPASTNSGPTNQTFTIRTRKGNDSWIWGLVLIGIGGVFLLQNLLNISITNWWAFFLLFPGLGSLVEAYNRYQTEQRFSRRVRNSIFAGVVFLGLMAFFLFSLNFGQYWAIWLVLAGVLILINAFLPD